MRILPALLLIFAFSGCTAFTRVEKPASLDPVEVAAPAARVYDEALALAFDRGYQIVYASEEEGLIEMDVFVDKAFLSDFFNPDLVRRLGVLVREGEGPTRVHARYHSFHASGGGARVRDGDREAAEVFVDALQQRLAAQAAR